MPDRFESRDNHGLWFVFDRKYSEPARNEPWLHTKNAADDRAAVMNSQDAYDINWQGTSTDQTAQHLEGGTTFRLRVKIEQNTKSVNQEFTAEVEGAKLIADMESDLHNALDACATQASRMVAYMRETEDAT